MKSEEETEFVDIRGKVTHTPHGRRGDDAVAHFIKKWAWTWPLIVALAAFLGVGIIGPGKQLQDTNRRVDRNFDADSIRGVQTLSRLARVERMIFLMALNQCLQNNKTLPDATEICTDRINSAINP